MHTFQQQAKKLECTMQCKKFSSTYSHTDKYFSEMKPHSRSSITGMFAESQNSFAKLPSYLINLERFCWKMKIKFLNSSIREEESFLNGNNKLFHKRISKENFSFSWRFHRVFVSRQRAGNFEGRMIFICEENSFIFHVQKARLWSFKGKWKSFEGNLKSSKENLGKIRRGNKALGLENFHFHFKGNEWKTSKLRNPFACKLPLATIRQKQAQRI